MDSPRLLYGSKGKAFHQGNGVSHVPHELGGPQRPQFRGESQPVRRLRVDERLDTQAIPCQEQVWRWWQPFGVCRSRAERFPPVQQGEREHAAKALHTRHPPLPERGQDHLSVSVGAEAVAEGFQLGTQLTVIIDLTVKGDDKATARVGHGLTARVGKVHDGQAPVTEPSPGLLIPKHPLPVRSPVGLGHCHTGHEVACIAKGAKKSADTAHVTNPVWDQGTGADSPR